jgi:hypothetical protein
MRLSLVSLGLLLLASAAHSQGLPQPSREHVAERTAFLQSLDRGKLITANTQQYQHLAGVVAIERKNLEETPEEAVSRGGAAGAQIVETKRHLVLYRDGQKRPAWVERKAGITTYPTVLNTRTGATGVLTGTLVVKPKNMSDAARLASNYGLETIREYPHLQTVLYRVRPNIDIADIVGTLQSDQRVENAYPEITVHEASPN